MGPTGSGKTSLALELYKTGHFSGIVNVDASQAYRQVSVGVAKPSAEEVSVAPHYLFGVVDCVPQSLNAAQYRLLVESLLQKELKQESRPPLLVGGTLFYAKSLFLKLQNLIPETDFSLAPREEGVSDWEYLKKIDPVRADNIHPHDSYRISRALEIYSATGCLPSLAAPLYDPVFSESLVIWVALPDPLLRSQITKRVGFMLDQGWIEEVESFMGTEWEVFARDGFALGYDDVYAWIKAGKNVASFEGLSSAIAAKTWTYARRQKIFWGSLKKHLSDCKDVTIVESSPQDVSRAVLDWLI